MKLSLYKNVEHIVHAVSSKTGFGLNHLKYSMINALMYYPARDLKGKEESLIKFIEENKTLRAKRKRPNLLLKESVIKKRIIRNQKNKPKFSIENKENLSTKSV